MKKPKGITLIALIITIVVLLILAVVTIRAVQGDGIIAKAKESTSKYTSGQSKEGIMLGEYEYQLEIANSKPSEGLEYEESEFGSGAVRGRGTCTDSKIVIPSKTPNGHTIDFVDGFSEDTLIKALVLPDTITRTDYRAFINCTNLNKILLPSTIEYIYSDTFQNTGYWNNANNWENGVLYLQNYVLSGAANNIDKPIDTISGSVKIKDGITTLATASFANCTDITSVTIPKSVTMIRDSSFSNCTNLAAVNYEGTMEEWNKISIGVEVFTYPTFDDSGEFAGMKYINATYVQCSDGRVDLPLQ